MATDLGKVGMRMRGAWSSSVTYEVLDVVTYNNGTYIAKQAVPANTIPTNTTYWQAACVLSNLDTVVASDTVSDSNLGSITYKKYLNGFKSIYFSNASVSASATIGAEAIPESYRPSTVIFGFFSTWNNSKARRIQLLTNDWTVRLAASDEAGASGIIYYI